MKHKESRSRSITLHDDDPTMFARVFEFLYSGTIYDIRSNYSRDSRVYALKIAAHANVKQLENNDQSNSFRCWPETPVIPHENDLSSSFRAVHFATILIADKYGIDGLVNLIIGICFYPQDEWDSPIFNHLVSQRSLFWKLVDKIGRDVIDRHAVMRNAFADMAAINFCDIMGDDLKSWCNADRSFNWRVMATLNCMRRYRCDPHPGEWLSRCTCCAPSLDVHDGSFPIFSPISGCGTGMSTRM